MLQETLNICSRETLIPTFLKISVSMSSSIINEKIEANIRDYISYSVYEKRISEIIRPWHNSILKFPTLLVETVLRNCSLVEASDVNSNFIKIFVDSLNLICD